MRLCQECVEGKRAKKRPMARPQLYPIKKVIGFDRDMLDAIDAWRRVQSPIPTVSDAIRRLVELGLAASDSNLKIHRPEAVKPDKSNK